MNPQFDICFVTALASLVISLCAMAMCYLKT